MSKDPIRLFVTKKRFPQQVLSQVLLTDEELHYCQRVVRQGPGAVVEILDGAGQVAYGVLAGFGKNAYVKVESIDVYPNLLPKISLYVGMLKGDKMDWVIEKTTELGVDRIVPVVSRYSVVGDEVMHNKVYPRQERWQKIAEAAARQSNRTILPEIGSPLFLQDALHSSGSGAARLIFHEKTPNAHWPIGNYLRNTESIDLFIGPEGGFSQEEILLAEEKGCLCCGLGSLRLRAETAAVFAVGLCRYSTIYKDSEFV